MKTLKRLILSLLILVLVLLAGAGGWSYWRSCAALPQLDGTVRVAGLAGPVEVRRDARGVPHLSAASPADLFFAQGYVTAQDRLWQMDLSRRLAEGELSEILGERTLPYDEQIRTEGIRQTSERALAELDPAPRAMLRSYADGVNAFIAGHPDRLPIEFLLLRYRPRPWSEIDSLAESLILARMLSITWPMDLMRERIRAKLCPQLAADLFPEQSPLDEPVAQVPATSLKPRAGAAAVPDLDAPSIGCGAKAGDEPPATAGVDPAWAALARAPEIGELVLGSNNWVVSGAHTRSGKPLLANDPHMELRVPSVWYLVHLQAQGLDEEGASFPGIPLVVIGHNQRIAWGMTNTLSDVQDLFAETFDPNHPGKYLHNGAWVDAEIRTEVIKVRSKPDVRLSVTVTRHGPVVSHDGGRNLALQWTALEPHALSLAVRSSAEIARAQNWTEFTSALRDFTGPMQNFVYADVDGNIGYYAAGWVPLRKKGRGEVPVPGSSDDYDWIGYIPFQDLPQSFNPAGGIIATANARVAPDNYPYFITSLWEAPYRTARIFARLRAGGNFSVDDMQSVQFDIVALDDKWMAGQLLQAASSHPPRDAEAQYAINLLRNWDGQATMDSGATLVCEVTRRALLERILKPKLGEDLSGYRWFRSTQFLANVLANNWVRWLPPGDASFSDTLMAALHDGIKQIPKRAGDGNPRQWQWGSFARLLFEHPLGQFFPLNKLLNVGPFPQAGKGTTVKAAGPAAGSSMRMVVDLADLDHSVQNLPLGQSGQVFSPYYKDQFDAWYHGRSFPMPFSDPAVEQSIVHKLLLRP